MWKNFKWPTAQKIENENKLNHNERIYATIFQNKICSKKFSTQNVEECYWFEFVPKLSDNVAAKVIVIKILRHSKLVLWLVDILNF